MADYTRRGDNSWRLTVSLGKSLGGKKIRERKTITVDDPAILKSETKLTKYLDTEWLKFKIEVETGAYISSDKMKIIDFCEEWKKLYGSNPNNLSPATYKNYCVVIDSRIVPTFGHMKVDQVTTMQLANYLQGLSKSGSRIVQPSKKTLTEEQIARNNKPLDIETIGYIYRVLKNIFSRAVEWKSIKENPMNGVTKPASKDARTKMLAERSNPQYYSEEEAQKVVDALYQESIKWRLLILGSLIGGCRRGEMIGLEWFNVKSDEALITIENNIPLSEKGKPVEKGPKSIASYRDVDMPDWYMGEMIMYLNEWLQERKELIDSGKWLGEQREYVFHNGTGAPYYYQHPSKWWVRFCKRHNIRYIKFHGLRHSTGSLMLEDEDESNFDSILIAIQKRLGHSRLSTSADTYVHLSKKVKKRTTAKFEKFGREADNESGSAGVQLGSEMKIRRVK